MKPKIRSLIVAYGQNNLVIANNEGNIPWHLPDEYKHFSDTTKKVSLENPKGIDGIPLIMGRKNYESLPERFRPLPGRQSIVLTENLLWTPKEKSDKIMVAHSLWEALDYAEQAPGDEIFCIGGEEVYQLMIKEVTFQKLYLTCVHGNFEGNKVFPIRSLRIAERYVTIKTTHHLKDDRHAHPFSIMEYSLIS